MQRNQKVQFIKSGLFLTLLLGVVPLYSCHGTLEIWQLGETLGDDDDEPPQLDYSAFEGMEFINVDWDQEAWPQGVDDCQADWFALGSETTAVDQAPSHGPEVSTDVGAQAHPRVPTQKSRHTAHHRV